MDTGLGIGLFPDDMLGGFDPRGVANLSLWVMGDVGVGVDGSNNVQTWQDQSGNGHDLAQGSAPLRPLPVAGGLNGHKTVRFASASSQFMQVVYAEAPTNKTVFIVYKSILIGAAATNDIIFDGAVVGGCILASTNAPATQLYDGVILSAPLNIANGVFSIVTCVFSGASSFIRENQVVKVGPGDAGATISPGGFTLAALANASRFSDIEVAEVLAYDRVLQASEISANELRLKARYAL